MLRAVAILFVLTGACGMGAGESTPFVYDNNVFTQTTSLTAALSPTGSSMPNVSWPSTKRPLVVAGFFVHRMDVRQHEITNARDLVWLWHTGLARGREGDVTWSDGAPVQGGVPQEGVEPGPLASGTYYWAVWAFDDSGNIVASTVENVHVVP